MRRVLDRTPQSGEAFQTVNVGFDVVESPLGILVVLIVYLSKAMELRRR